MFFLYLMALTVGHCASVSVDLECFSSCYTLSALEKNAAAALSRLPQEFKECAEKVDTAFFSRVLNALDYEYGDAHARCCVRTVCDEQLISVLPKTAQVFWMLVVLHAASMELDDSPELGKNYKLERFCSTGPVSIWMRTRYVRSPIYTLFEKFFFSKTLPKALVTYLRGVRVLGLDKLLECINRKNSDCDEVFEGHGDQITQADLAHGFRSVVRCGAGLPKGDPIADLVCEVVGKKPSSYLTNMCRTCCGRDLFRHLFTIFYVKNRSALEAIFAQNGRVRGFKVATIAALDAVYQQLIENESDENTLSAVDKIFEDFA